MGVSTNANISFGVDLGEDGEHEYPWQPEEADECHSEYLSAWWEKLHPGVPVPVEIHYHCSYSYPMFVFAVPGTKQTVYRGDADQLTMKVPTEKSVAHFKAFMAEHMPAVEDAEPKWLLYSLWG